MKAFIGIILCIPFLFWAGIRTYRSVTFGIDCGGHMERAGSANSIELARQEMEMVVKYADAHNMTSGYTSILYNTPDEDVGFWYNNMKASLEELCKVGAESTPLEKSNILIKLRESLLRHGDKSTHITVPEGISVFPNNIAFCFLGVILTIMGVIGALLVWAQIDEN